MIIVSTGTPDYPIPGTAPIVQEKLGIKECAVMVMSVKERKCANAINVCDNTWLQRMSDRPAVVQ